jgi:indolepyruvate decarboxylase
MSNPTVADYLASRLADLGIDRAFGVPGDYAFSFDDAIEACPGMSWVLCANELNAAYAADGYARRFGAALLTTTYGVGELSALNGIMGSRAHRLPVFHVVGAPSRRIIRQGLITHHSLGDGDYDNFAAISATAACVSTVLTPENAIEEIDRVINQALRQSMPAYIVVPMDYGKMPIIGIPHPGKHLSEIRRQASNLKELEEAVEGLIAALQSAKRPVALPSMFAARYGLKKKLEAFITKSNIPFATSPMDKSVVSEAHPCYLGLYNGDFSAPLEVKSVVESADLVLDIGGFVPVELNTGFWSNNLSNERVIAIHENWVQIGTKIWLGCAIEDVLDALIQQTPVFNTVYDVIPPYGLLDLIGQDDDPTGSPTLYPRIQRMLRPGDIFVVETGSGMLHTNRMRLPANVDNETQTLWGSIGWATPALMGMALAQPERRLIAVTGDGAHGMTLNELSVMGRYGIKPIIFVLKNDIHGVEDVVGDLGHIFNVLPVIEYHELPKAMGCENWLTAKVSTVRELDDIIRKIESHDGAAYIAVMIPKEESQPLPEWRKDQAYKVATPDSE